MINKVYRVIVRKNPNTQENGKSQEAKTGLQNQTLLFYLNSGNNLMSILTED
jgi:hypothetical protein